MPTPFKEALNSGKFVVTSELAPPKGTNLEKFKHHIELLKDKVDAMNVTDHQSSVMRYPSLGGCLMVREMGGEVILQMTCRDRNRLALQADLLFASSRASSAFSVHSFSQGCDLSPCVSCRTKEPTQFVSASDSEIEIVDDDDDDIVPFYWEEPQN